MKQQRLTNSIIGGEVELDGLAGELLVDGGEGLELEVNLLAVLGVEVNLEELALVRANAGALGDDLSGVHEVVEDGSVHGSQGAAARAEGTGGLASVLRK